MSWSEWFEAGHGEEVFTAGAARDWDDEEDWEEDWEDEDDDWDDDDLDDEDDWDDDDLL